MIQELGRNRERILEQIELFKRPPSYLTLLRPCTLGDGIEKIEEDRVNGLVSTLEREALQGRCLSFVPASGAASRMFKELLHALDLDSGITRDKIVRKGEAGHGEARQILLFWDNIQRFAFYDDLEKAVSKAGLELNVLLEEGRIKEVVEFLLSERGLGYGSLPKGLLQFHKYVTGPRTPFEEHLVEAASFTADAQGKCRLHFTVSPAHLELFKSLLDRVRPYRERELGVSFQVTFSVQKESTDTVAVDLENRPFRLEDGEILFRPAGHGALIENLNDLQGDILFIKNIDNVVPDRLKGITGRWRKILGGRLLHLQNRVFSLLERLSPAGCEEPLLDEAADFLQRELSTGLPPHFSVSSPAEKQAFLLERLHRPLRVCGMVRNLGEPGGGPFWVREKTGGSSLQIVESAQVDPRSEVQQAILAASTHFNPVDIVCGVRDRHGNPFDLRRYVDPDAYLITRKSHEGRELKALELPGLWNGGMARWITVFVEVPLQTFNPVKTVNDLLRDAHQPAE
jgi:hypothetical protein